MQNKGFFFRCHKNVISFCIYQQSDHSLVHDKLPIKVLHSIYFLHLPVNYYYPIPEIWKQLQILYAIPKWHDGRP